MIRFVKLVAGVVVGAMAFALPLHAADNQDVIEYRQHIMKTLDAQAASLGMIVSTQIPDDNVVKHAEAIALTAKQVLKSFEPKVQGGESKPEVWAKWPDFEKRVKDFVEKTDKMAQAAKTDGANAVFEQMVDALSCKSCHDTYRVKK